MPYPFNLLRGISLFLLAAIIPQYTCKPITLRLTCCIFWLYVMQRLTQTKTTLKPKGFLCMMAPLLLVLSINNQLKLNFSPNPPVLPEVQHANSVT